MTANVWQPIFEICDSNNCQGLQYYGYHCVGYFTHFTATNSYQLCTLRGQLFFSQLPALCTLCVWLPAFIPNLTSEAPALYTLSPLLTQISKLGINAGSQTQRVQRAGSWEKKSCPLRVQRASPERTKNHKNLIFSGLSLRYSKNCLCNPDNFGLATLSDPILFMVHTSFKMQPLILNFNKIHPPTIQSDTLSKL